MNNSGDDVIFAGVGGMGALTSGQLLAKAALKEYKYTTWYPNITTARRNAPADCLVRFSNNQIYSQLIHTVGTAIVMNNIQFDSISKRLSDGGLLFIEKSSSFKDETEKKFRVIRVPGMEISSKIANPRVINIIYLGVYIGVTETISPELIELELSQRFNMKEELLDINIRAFNEGIKFGAAH